MNKKDILVNCNDFHRTPEIHIMALLNNVSIIHFFPLTFKENCNIEQVFQKLHIALEMQCSYNACEPKNITSELTFRDCIY